jgi:hypothetical protein
MYFDWNKAPKKAPAGPAISPILMKWKNPFNPNTTNPPPKMILTISVSIFMSASLSFV